MDRPASRIAGAVVAVLLCSAAAACARPVGDFGRAAPSALHDDIMPTLGRNSAQLNKTPGSSFNLSDTERDMHNRVWRFLVAPHAEDWFMDTAVELQRTGLGRPRSFEPSRYYKWLREARYQSSRIRYNTIADHAQADIGTAPQTFLAICRVIETDRQRAVASQSLSGLSAGDVQARRSENEMFIGWFVASLRYRYDAYSYALDHLLVETPHEEAMAADATLSELAIWVERAERRDFCSQATSSRYGGGQAIPSRILSPAPSEGVYKK